MRNLSSLARSVYIVGLVAVSAIVTIGCGDGENHDAGVAGAQAGSSGGVSTSDASGTGGAEGGTGTGGAEGGTGTGGASGGSGTGDSVDGGTGTDAGSGNWWEGVSWTLATWPPAECVVRLADDPAAIPKLQWKPMTLGDLVGETPDVPLGHYYQEASDGTSWVRGQISSTEYAFVERDATGTARAGIAVSNCLVNFVRTGTDTCIELVVFDVVPVSTMLACGDLRAPDPVVVLPGGFIQTSSDELVVVQQDFGDTLNVIDLNDASVSSAVVGGPHEYETAAAYGHDLYAVYMSQATNMASSDWRGVLYAWDGGDGYTQLWDPMPLAVVDVQANATTLVWTETEVFAPYTGTSIYRAALPVTAGSLSPTLVRKIEPSIGDPSSFFGAGQIAFALSIEVQLVGIDDGVRHKVPVPAPWAVRDNENFVNDRHLGFQMFDSTDHQQHQVTFRANLADVLALPSD